MDNAMMDRWTINGVRTSDGTGVAAPAITALWMDRNFKIIEAYSFYDEMLIDGNYVPPPFNGSDVAWKVSAVANFRAHATVVPLMYCKLPQCKHPPWLLNTRS